MVSRLRNTIATIELKRNTTLLLKIIAILRMSKRGTMAAVATLVWV